MRKPTYILFLWLVFSACSGLKNSSSVIPEGPKKAEVSPFDNTIFSAMTEKSLGNLDKAYGFFQQCVEIDNTQALPFYELARLDVKNNNLDLAIANAKNAFEKDQKNEWYCAILADAYQKKADYKNAIVYYKKAIANNPDNQSYYKKVIKNYSLSQNSNGAIEYLNLMENKFGVSEELSFEKYDIFLAEGKFQLAEKELQTLIAYFPTELRYRGMLAEFYGNQGEMDKALIQYDVMKEMDPDNGLLHWQLAHHYGSIGQETRAFDEFVLAFRSNEILEEHKIEVVRGYLQNNKKDEVESLVSILQKKYPNSSTVNELVGDVLMENNDFSHALKSYHKAIQTNKSSQDLWMKTMKLSYSLGEGKLLENEATKATDLFPVQPICYLYKALGQSMTGKYKEAKTTLSIGKEFVIDNEILMGLFLEQLGTVEHYLGNNLKANENFNKALAKAPNDPQVFGSHLLYLLELEQLSEVQAALDKKTFDKTLPIMQHVQAQLYASQNKLQESFTIFEKLIYSSAGSNALIQEHFGDLLLKKGNKTGAIRIWQEVFEKTGNPRISKKIQNS